jgi:hypothetical protein
VSSQNNIPNPFVKEKGMAGLAWIQGILRRNPMIAYRKVQYLDPGRAQKLSRFTVNDCCAKLKITQEELGVINKPECIYKVKEKRCSLCLHKQPLVLI